MAETKELKQEVKQENKEVKHETKQEPKPESNKETKKVDSKKTDSKKPEVKKLEREYIIPLRKAWLKVPMYERSKRAVNTIKKFLAKHMKVIDRNPDNVRLDIYLNNEIWFRGRTNPPAKIKVKAIKEGDIVKVELADIPQHVKFLKAKHEKLAKKAEAKNTEPSKEKPAETKEEETKETAAEKKDEQEKEISSAESKAKEAEVKVKEQKHMGKAEKAQRPQRMALKK